MKRIVAQSVCISALILSQAAAPAPAQAQTQSSWSLAGAGCVPTGQTASGTGTFNSAGDAGFPAGRVGEIIVTCPVPSSVTRAAFMSVTYRDTDGPGNGVQLRATLRQKSLENGGVSDVPRATVDSNGFAAVSSYSRRGALLGNPCNGTVFTLDHGRFAYYVQVNMTSVRMSGLCCWRRLTSTASSFADVPSNGLDGHIGSRTPRERCTAPALSAPDKRRRARGALAGGKPCVTERTPL